MNTLNELFGIDAQTEARYLMIASNNILKLSDGEPISVPYQDMLYGIYYLTVELPNEKGEGEFMKSRNHRSLYYETDWYNKGITYDNNGKPIPLQGQERKDWEDFRNRYDLDTSGRFYKYIPRK